MLPRRVWLQERQGKHREPPYAPEAPQASRRDIQRRLQPRQSDLRIRLPPSVVTLGAAAFGQQRGSRGPHPRESRFGHSTARTMRLTRDPVRSSEVLQAGGNRREQDLGQYLVSHAVYGCFPLLAIPVPALPPICMNGGSMRSHPVQRVQRGVPDDGCEIQSIG